MNKVFIIVVIIIVIILLASIVTFGSKIFTKKSPTQAYLAICKEVDNSKNYNEAYALLKKYTTQDYQDRLIQQTGGLPANFADNSEEADQWFQSLKSKLMGVPLSRLQVSREEIKGDVADLYLGDKGNGVASGRVTLKLKDGNWKIDDESWVYDYVVPPL